MPHLSYFFLLENFALLNEHRSKIVEDEEVAGGGPQSWFNSPSTRLALSDTSPPSSNVGVHALFN